MRALITLALSAALSLVLQVGALSPPVSGATGSEGSIGIRLSDVTEGLADNPRAQAYIIDNLPPGTEMTRHIVVSNSTDAPVDLDLYVSAANVNEGSFNAGPKGSSNPLTSWIKLDKQGVRLDPGTEETVAVNINVPKNAPETEQYAVIWASTKAPETPSSGINAINRVGVRVYLSVGEGNGPPSDFSISSLVPVRNTDGSVSIVANVENTGGRAVDLSGTLNLSGGPGGLSVPVISAPGSTIAPHKSGEVTIPVPESANFPAGPWKAEVKLESGFNKHDMSASITFPDKGAGAAVGASSSGWPIGAWIGIAVGILVVALALAVYVLRHRRRAAGADMSPAASSESDR